MSPSKTTMHPDLPGYVVEDGFADVYARPGLDLGLLQVGLYAGVPRALNAIRVLREVEADAGI